MNYYELTILIPSDFKEEKIEETRSEIVSLLEKEGAKIENVEKPVVKNLGYTIKDKKSSFLISIIFNLNPEKIGLIEKGMKEKKELLRFLITKKEKREQKPKRREKPKELKETKKESPKVEFKEIEKKLDEILGEQ
jgi:ribosomal protein S6